MNTITIKKAIDLLKQDKTSELEYILNSEYLQALRAESGTPKRKVDYLKLAKKYIDKMDDSRPNLKAVLRDSNGKQFILNGYSGIRFLQNAPELDILPQTPQADTVDIDRIIGNIYDHTRYTTTNDDLFIFDNIEKIKKILVTKLDKTDNNLIPITFLGKYFNTDMILQIKRFINTFGNITLITSQGKERLTIIRTNELEIIILPVRINEANELHKIVANTINELKA